MKIPVVPTRNPLEVVSAGGGITSGSDPFRVKPDFGRRGGSAGGKNDREEVLVDKGDPLGKGADVE